uniref:Small ribosomal subunit protein uS15c n=1 Tax=Drosera erythrorhiza TaxID=2005751 RepID=A0A1Z1GBD1_9CARY|nr:ribosomal protein S15 [Drosera erythrorhiza]YP_009390934.1 ribosomal protein S15 [Drosera erythrorhiza]ARV87530.1 ribosomal protein S15 [Drosera erythrorhiza]ARV87561.1 ribosomal protein S15 [Drosera erythrorhiza]
MPKPKESVISKFYRERKEEKRRSKKDEKRRSKKDEKSRSKKDEKSRSKKDEKSRSKKEEKKRSVEFQVVCFTNKIQRLTSHLELHKTDYSSERGLRKILGKRQRILAYLLKKSPVRYKELISQLTIRELKRP